MIEISVKQSRPNFTLDVSIKLGHGITALFGASGAGKSSLLNLIAGLEQPDSGRISIGSESLYDSRAKINLAVHKRRIGYVFQDRLQGFYRSATFRCSRIHRGSFRLYPCAEDFAAHSASG